MKAYNQLAERFETLCEQHNVSPPVGTSQELTKSERINNVQGMVETVENQLPESNATADFLDNCQEFLSAQ